MVKHAFIIPVLAAALLAAGACGVHSTNTPSLTGPSGFALSVGITASPDSISQDGGSQSSLRVTARDANGAAIVGETFRLDVLVNGSQIDFGTLSARTLVTGSDGTASAIYTAPPASPSGAITASCGTIATGAALAGQCVSILATPISGPGTSNDFSAAQSQSVQIRLMPVGLIVPTVQATPQFTVTPASPAANTPAVFDATSSCAGQLNSSGACPAGSGSVVSYQWSFGDGAAGTGAVVTHTYSTAQAYSVTLTITTDTGGTAQKTTSINVGGSNTAP
ncbi:MAG TPA: PKD domain-containing protein, partial [Vicinamibacterales bacterium]|nr:PKD domain-containing protein [Vicinamibacterales bacterium]